MPRPVYHACLAGMGGFYNLGAWGVEMDVQWVALVRRNSPAVCWWWLRLPRVGQRETDRGSLTRKVRLRGPCLSCLESVLEGAASWAVLAFIVHLGIR